MEGTMSLNSKYKEECQTLSKFKRELSGINFPDIVHNIGFIIETSDGYYAGDYKTTTELQEAKFIYNLSQSSHSITCGIVHKKIPANSRLRHAIIEDDKIRLVNVSLDKEN